MSLMNPTLGELLDRKVLLKLKIEHCKENGLPSKHFAEEISEIDMAIAGKNVLRFTPGRLADLETVHRALWVIVQSDSTQRLLDTNRRRHEIRELIDREAGDYKGPEKV